MEESGNIMWWLYFIAESITKILLVGGWLYFGVMGLESTDISNKMSYFFGSITLLILLVEDEIKKAIHWNEQYGPEDKGGTKKGGL